MMRMNNKEYLDMLQRRYDERHRPVPWWKKKAMAILVKIRGW